MRSSQRRRRHFLQRVLVRFERTITEFAPTCAHVCVIDVHCDKQMQLLLSSKGKLRRVLFWVPHSYPHADAPVLW